MSNQLYKGDTPLATFVPEIVDNLTTSDSTKVLSAKQGKILNDRLDSMSFVESNEYSSQVLSGCTIRVRKINRVITVCVYTQTTTTSGSEVEIYALPQKYWPSTTFNFPLSGTSNNYCRISIDGKIILASNNSYASGSVCMI